MALTEDGGPLGLAAAKFWTRKKFKGTNALKGKINSTRIPIEVKESHRWVENVKLSTRMLGDPGRCVHIGDRESDIYELFCAAKEAGTFFLARTCVERLAEDGKTTVATAMKIRCVRDTHRIEVRDKNGKVSHAKLKIKLGRIKVLPPIGKHKRYPALPLTVIYAYEAKAPKGRERIEWKLLTNLPVRILREAIEKLDWYAMRWKIEIFHKILKSGSRAEESKLRAALRLTTRCANLSRRGSSYCYE